MSIIVRNNSEQGEHNNGRLQNFAIYVHIILAGLL
jgi:hypothetical protein